MVYAGDGAAGLRQRLASILGTYLLKPVINTYILPGDIPGLVNMLILHGNHVPVRRARPALGYNQLMVHISQKVVSEIRPTCSNTPSASPDLL